MDSTLSSSTHLPTVYQYDAFLSFYGEDIRHSFIDHLYAALHRAGISAFRDDEIIKRGKELKPEIERYITQSRASIIVITKNYASSCWCLRELCLILEERRKGSHFVLPVYYGVDPSDVRKQRGSFRIQAKEGSMWTVNNVNQWKAALTEFTKLEKMVVSGYETEFIPKIVDKIYLELGLNMKGKSISKLFVSSKEIAKGSNGTVVYEGIYDGRKVAVKRLVKAHHDAVSREIQNLIAADKHSNIVRWYDTTSDRNFFYLSLERCDCTLYDLIQNKMYSDSFQLMKPNGYPSDILLVLMRDMSAGLAHLHKLKIIHRDMKPHNVLIVRGDQLCVKLADMGISKPLDGDASSLGPHATVSGTSGWRAPEQIPRGRERICHGRQTTAMDVFSLGSVFFFCMTGGRHPFGDTDNECEQNVIKNKKVKLFLLKDIPEARDLCFRMLNPKPECRPKASEVLLHPLFWSFEMRMSFMRDTSDRVEPESRKVSSVVGITVLGALRNKGYVVFCKSWDGVLDLAFLDEMKQKRKWPYRYNMLQDLLRFVRNTINHYGDLSKDIQGLFGSMPEGIDDYFRSKFPKLLIEVYHVMYQHCKHEGWFRRYLET